MLIGDILFFRLSLYWLHAGFVGYPPNYPWGSDDLNEEELADLGSLDDSDDPVVGLQAKF